MRRGPVFHGILAGGWPFLYPEHSLLRNRPALMTTVRFFAGLGQGVATCPQPSNDPET